MASLCWRTYNFPFGARWSLTATNLSSLIGYSPIRFPAERLYSAILNKRLKWARRSDRSSTHTQEIGVTQPFGRVCAEKIQATQACLGSRLSSASKAL